MAASSSVVPMSLKLNDVDPEEVEFRLFTDNDIRKLSVAKITSSQSFDVMGNPVTGGVYDLRMGPARDWHDVCGTCLKTLMLCSGHFGHIELPKVVVNPLFIKQIYTLFRISCLRCHKIQMTGNTKALLKLQLNLLDAGHITSALDLESYSGEVLEKDSNKPVKALKHYYKLLKNSDPVTDKFKNKNASVVRTRILTNYIKFMNVMNVCMYCKTKLLKVKTSENRITYNEVHKTGRTVKIMMPDEIQELCTKLAEADQDILIYCIPILKHVSITPVTNAFFMEVIPVPPPVVRPCNFLQGVLMEHPQSNIYKDILSTALSLRTALKIMSAPDTDFAVNNLDQEPRIAYETAYGKSPAEKVHNSWQDLQKNVLSILDSEGNTVTNSGSASVGIKQVIERKTGVIRMHMMGKRVNFAARSVITPDPNVDIDEIGIPDAFAKKLTYPVYVTPWNVDELRKMVINGPNNHPGADKIEIDNGRIIKIPENSLTKRKSLAKRLLTPDEYQSSSLKIVHRHLLNGDVLILNRQPSLHKPSMMAHRARILKGEKTLRLHYANCKSYNADFDGDEMNAHFPQNEIARSEAYNIMSVRKQYLVPKDGTPLSGLIQDHVISGVKMSLRGTFFTKSDYQQLVFQGLASHKGEIKLLPPTILKPVMLWSGKQVLSTIIINNIPKGQPLLSLDSSAKISAKAWQKEPPRRWYAGGTPFSDPNTMSEAEVIIRKGELISGVLDKTHYGATPYGLVHCMFELYGGYSSSALLSSFSKAFTYYLQWAGFTLGVKDILVVLPADEERDALVRAVRLAGREAAAKATELPDNTNDDIIKEHIEDNLLKDPKFRPHLDRQYKMQLDTFTNKINTVCLTHGLLEKFPYNNLQLMVQSGAKGSTVNTMQISCLLGQIELEGKRPPLMISGKSLPSFPAYDLSPRAGGFIDGRFMTGIQPQEFFFHCMAGREGLIDTAVKTSRSGYLQRCLIKHLEGISIGYDHTVRDADSSVIQFAYGEDGLDILKCQFLNGKQLKFLDENSSAVISKSTLKSLKENADTKSVKKSLKSIKKWVKKNGDPTKKHRSSPFSWFSKSVKDEIELDNPTDRTRDPFYWQMEKMWREMDEDTRNEYKLKVCPEPLQSKMSPEFKFGVINEQLEGLVQKYLKNRRETLYTEYTEKEKFVEVLNAKYLASMVDPGEPVGLLAAQSIGEPSTQMTLNTFHFAGRGDMNVTLGIPRLREILMTASANLKTPNMDIPFRQDLPNLHEEADKLRKSLNKVRVADVLEKIDVTCKLYDKAKKIHTTFRFCFLPHSQYKSLYCVTPSQIIKHMERKFFSEMFTVIKKQQKIIGGVVWTDEKKVSIRRRGAKDDDDDDGDGEERAAAPDSSDDEGPNDDNDNTDAKLRSKRAEEQEYEDPESGEEEKEDEELLQDEDEQITQQEAKEEISAKDQRAIEKVMEKVSQAHHYTFDTKMHEWCELTVLLPINFLKTDLSQALREAANKSVMHEVKNIKRAITMTEKNVLSIKTEGINISQMVHYNTVLDLNKLYSNDVHAIAGTYGIEAAVQVIKQEIKNVFNVYGISVDPRHLSLIADYMTYNGKFEPMSRKGMEASSSPLQQMSFESSMLFLKQAVLNAKSDQIRSASSCLMLGQPCKTGTGSFSLQHSRQEIL